MAADAYVFNGEHAGNPLLEGDQELPLLDLRQFARDAEQWGPSDEQIAGFTELCRRVRAVTDRAVFCADYLHAGIGCGMFHGIGIFPMICMLEPAYVLDLHEIVITATLRRLRAVVPAIAPYVDIVLVSADDWGTQSSLIASPEVYRTLFQPFYRRVNDEIHRLAPAMKTFLHCCGAVYPLLDAIADSGFDILNPVQWSAGTQSYREWKDRVRGRMAFWGGGVDSQHTLPLGTIAAVEREVDEVTRYLGQGGGYVFCNIHNLLAEIAPEKILAMYRTAGSI